MSACRCHVCMCIILNSVSLHQSTISCNSSLGSAWRSSTVKVGHAEKSVTQQHSFKTTAVPHSSPQTETSQRHLP
jgi:hypothetical protein